MVLIIYGLSFVGSIIIKYYYGNFLSLAGLIPITLLLYMVIKKTYLSSTYYYFIPIVICIIDILNVWLTGYYFPTIGIYILAFSEELVFRYYIDDELQALYGSKIASIFGTIIFVVVHIPKYGFTRSSTYPQIAAIAILLLFVKRKTGNIFIGSTVHYLVNTILTIFLPAFYEIIINILYSQSYL